MLILYELKNIIIYSYLLGFTPESKQTIPRGKISQENGSGEKSNSRIEFQDC